MSKRSRALRYYRSYKPQGPVTKSIRFIVKLVVVVFLLYLIINTFFFRTYLVDVSTRDQQPVYAGRILATPLLYGPRVEIVDYRLPVLRTPKRGDVVIVETGNPPDLPWYAVTLNSLARFFSFYQFVPFEEDEFSSVSRYQVRRVVGMPGDEVKMNDYRVKIKTSTSNHFIDEQEVVQIDYTLVVPQLPKLTGQEEPGSLAGVQPAMQLDPGEYLLAPDDRSRFGLSKYWQPSEMHSIRSKALLVYWPQLTFL
jgi:signal peptidase I